MTEQDPANAAQIKAIIQQAVAMGIAEFSPEIGQLQRSVARLNAVVPEDGVPSGNSGVLKWLAGVAATLIGGVIMASLLWVGTSVTEMQQTLARIDERQKAQSDKQDMRFTVYDGRISRLERYHNIEGSAP